MSHLATVYAPWNGNAAAMAADIGELPVTVRQWRNRGKIDQRYWPRIVVEAAKRGFELSPADFVPPIDPIEVHASVDNPEATVEATGNLGDFSPVPSLDEAA